MIYGSVLSGYSNAQITDQNRSERSSSICEMREMVSVIDTFNDLLIESINL